jgi:NADH dehydrogenase FAD-containing subunit
VTKKRILILGGGFGGIYVAVHLGKMLSPRELEETEIALVNRENYIVFQPLLPEVISGSVELNHVIAPIRRMAPRANLYTRDIESIDPIARTVMLSPGIRPTPLTLSYDHLVIAMGTGSIIRRFRACMSMRVRSNISVMPCISAISLSACSRKQKRKAIPKAASGS